MSDLEQAIKTAAEKAVLNFVQSGGWLMPNYESRLKVPAEWIADCWRLVDADKLKRAKSDALVMHPGPMNRGVEIASEIADGPQSVIQEQVEMGVALRMAVIETLIETADRLDQRRKDAKPAKGAKA